ncbi:hypothetical protein I3843_09G157000 [Carya illinoinensis]|uniref:Uncharacterized protein n=2 Tax=Carya illinoinensis TaxID=32201 RepID=A0A922E4X4_CARIL|nr:uncharacterized protein LOC122275086 isoform X1 [Carya illinoinensis]KAG2689853.1 hypothetical protein I3760_09G159200 [Carya illinoinensis]KAG6696715.1 hypothetical protein I3842_09G162200 [Carya illinoinensis]KAG7964193.1 hypothetical protein I3843_09G157000 [Carya illinoinensis]
MMLANPRRNSYPSGQSSEGPMFQSSSHSHSISSFVLHFLKKPHAFPFLLSIFLFLTWLSLRLQHASHFSPTSYELKSSQDDDNAANLVRFSSGFPSPLAKDKRGWLLDPVSLALHSGILGGAVSCASVHVGEIRPGNVRGNHRHHTCNETFVMWGAKTKFRLENRAVNKGFAEVILGADEVAVATSPSGTAHALVNIDPIRSTFFLGCQDSIVNYSNLSTDFNVWKDF